MIKCWDECCVFLNEVKAMTNTPITREIYLYQDGVEYRDEWKSFCLKVDDEKMCLRLFWVNEGINIGKIKYKKMWPDHLYVVNEKTCERRMFDFEDTFEDYDWTIGKYNRQSNHPQNQKYQFYLLRKNE